MKDLKTHFTRHFVASATLLLLTVIAVEGPWLAPWREKIVAPLGLSPAALWLPAIALLAGLEFLISRHLIKQIADPMHRLMREAESGEQGFAFKTKSCTKEEDSIKHAIEAVNLRARSAREQADELESEIEGYTEKIDSLRQENAKLRETHETMAERDRNLIQANETLKASKVALELTLETERKSKVGAEVEKRTEEIYLQMEKAVEAAACQSVWIPSLVHELRSPILQIDAEAKKMQNHWHGLSFAQLNQAVNAIAEQSATQLELLNDILKRQVVPEPQTASSETIAPLPTPEHEPEEASAGEPAALAEPVEVEVVEAEPLAEDYRLKTLLEELATRFNRDGHADTHFSYALDEEQEIEIEDDSLRSLIQQLVATAADATRSGEVAIGAELRSESLVFDVACEGELSTSLDPASLAKAESLARKLGGQIEVDAPVSNELHLSFEYKFEGPEAIDVEIGSNVEPLREERN